MRRLMCACVVAVLTAPVTATAQQRLPDQPRPAARPLTIFTTASNVFDTNVNDDEDDGIRSIGVVLGSGAQFRDDPIDPTVDVTYEIGLHRYTQSDRWDRLSHQVRAAIDNDLSGPWSLETVGEITLKGTSDDRELSDQFVINPRLNYRFGGRHRLRTYAVLRLRRYDEDTDRNATNRYVGAEVALRAARGDRWRFGGRLEGNDAVGPRNDYARYTYYAEYTAPVSPRDQIEAEIRTRRQHYSARTVLLDGERVLVRDQRWLPAFAWTRRFNAQTDLRLGYALERRESNDLDREFTTHVISASITRRWW